MEAMSFQELGLTVVQCDVIDIRLRRLKTGAKLTQWEIKRSLRTALVGLPGDFISFETYTISSAMVAVHWRIPTSTTANQIANILQGKVLRVATPGGVANLEVATINVSRAGTSEEVGDTSSSSNSIVIHGVPAAWLSVQNAVIFRSNAPAFQFVSLFGPALVCECVPRRTSESLEPLPLEVDVFVRYSDAEAANRAMQVASHCVVRREGISYVCGPIVKFVDDASMSADALAQRSRRREKDQNKVERLHEEREKCSRALDKAQEKLESIFRESTEKREVLSGRVVVENINDCFKVYMHTRERLQEALDNDATRDEMKVLQHAYFWVK